MKEKIRNICKDLEKEKDIKILFAVENGSRAWRMNSKDSDYDVRFVFVRPLKDYIQINPAKDVINTAFDKEGNPCPAKGALIDISGFDIFKYTKLLSSSNPTTIEWLMSDIVYYGKQNEVFKSFAENNFNEISLYFHYKSLCKNNYEKYLKSGNLVTYKKYLYAYRGLINARWVEYKHSVPPIIFNKALDGMKDVIPKDIIEKLDNIIYLKSQGKEKDIIQNIVEMDAYIEDFLKTDPEGITSRSRSSLEILNDELRKIVLDYK